MSSARPLQQLKGDQAQASDPDRHVWLSASAGTGKTHVLSARVFRLLLRGVEPASILCLTFTKAGAAEMAERINARLAAWVRLPEHALREDLFALGESAQDPALVARARTLFARVLDAAGGGVRIQTIHSFCQALLAGFPLEAGLVPGFRPLEGREQAVLAREALADLLVDEERTGRSAVLDAIAALSLRMGEGRAEAFLAACADRPDALAALPSGIQPFLRRAFDLPSGDLGEELAACCGDATFDLEALERLAGANRAWGTATGSKAAEAIARWSAGAPAERVAALAELRALFLTKEGTLRKAKPKLVDAEPEYEELAEAIGSRCGELLSMQARAAYVDLLAGALEAGRAYARAYADAKRRVGAVDFDDLIRRTLALLRQPGIGDWVRFKLDLATEHVLVDEAQDTNPEQWAIVRQIVDEFFTGEGARAAGVRTLFVVGDHKQAIFSFQGTDPVFFAAAQAHFDALSRVDPDFSVAARPLNTLSLTHSFRSTRPILTFVDAAIEAMPGDGMGVPERERHASEVPGAGTVTLWPPMVTAGDEDGEEQWTADATRALAGRIAREVRAWIGTLPLGSKGRMLAAGDVMILVKKRGDLASLLVARLHAEGVPVAGVDRLRLNAPLAVQDLLAAIRFALQPGDDLSLASLLVSPLIGWSQEQLMKAAPRPGGTLWRHLRRTQPAEALAPLSGLLARADVTTPYRFLEEILSGPLNGRRKLLRRLGEEARDPIEELLNAALLFETQTTSSLQRFLDWFDRGDVEIKRDPAGGGAAVRVMTAHGAKGLQAPLVILADACIDPTQNRRDTLLWAPDGYDGAPFPVFRPRAGERDGPLDAALASADAKELQEHWRLFYVAATRAEERLVIAGAPGVRMQGQAPALSWHACAAAAMDRLGVAADADGVRTFSGGESRMATPRGVPAPAEPLPVPGWLRMPAPKEARPPRPLAPSSLGDDAVADPPPTPAMRAAAERGRLLHRLFERLPAVAHAERRHAGDRWLLHGAGVVDAAMRTTLLDAALAVIGDDRFTALFAPDALTEAPITAVVDGTVVAGTVDRLLVEEERVLVVDFKTGRSTPNGPSDVPRYHLRQMAAYAAALAVIFPGRRIEAALLYTVGPVLIPLDAAMLAAAKPD